MLTRLATAGLVALIHAAPAAAGPVKSGVYNLSPVGSKPSLNMSVAPSGKKVELFFLELPTSCHIGKVRPHYPTTFSPRQDLRIKKGGRFGYSEVLRGPRPGAIQKWRVSGRFSPDGRSVTVTGRYTLERPDGGCDTKKRKVVAPLQSLRSTGPFTGPYAGRTAAGEVITFNVERDRITDIKSRVTLKCDNGTSVVRDVRIAEVKIEDLDFRNDSIDGSFPDQFSVEGTLMPREPLPPTADDPEPGQCSANDTFTAKPARPLDS